MIQKLYSPVFCKLDAEEENYNYTTYSLSQREAADYVNEINGLIKRMELPDEKERGLMEYYCEGNSVDEKVKSLFINAEVIDGRLWGVTTINITEPLTAEETRLLKDYITGQMSDGFGESLEQRAIKVDYGNLYVSLWVSGNDFYIDTAQEFSERHGIELPEYTENLRAQLIERSEKNWTDYRNLPHNTAPDTLFNTSVEVISRRNAFVFIADYDSFTAEQLNCLLQFANPVELVADYLDPMSDISDMSAILTSITDQQEYYKQHYTLAETPAADDNLTQLRSQLIDKAETEYTETEIEKMQEALNERIEENYKDYCDSLRGLKPAEIMDLSSSIYNVKEAYYSLKHDSCFEPEQLEFLLRFENPLEIFSDFWERESNPIHLYQVTDMVFGDTGRVEEFYRLSDEPPVTAEKPDKTADKPLTGMAKLRKAGKEKMKKTKKTEKPEPQKSKNMRKHKHGRG